MDSVWESFQSYVVPYALNVLGALALVIGAYMVSGWVRRKIESTLGRTRFDATLTRFFANVARWVIILLAILACLSIFGIETTGFAAVIGAAGLAIGLAFQGTLSHLASGTMLLIFRPFKVGDVVRVAGETGKVYEIDLFMTSLDTGDNRRIIIPNSQVFGNVIENLTFHSTRRVDIEVGTAYDADLDQVRGILEAAARSVPNILPEPGIAVVLTGLGESSINWAVRVWSSTDKYWDVKDRLTVAVKKALDEAGVSIPFPQVEVHHVTPLKLEREVA